MPLGTVDGAGARARCRGGRGGAGTSATPLDGSCTTASADRSTTVGGIVIGSLGVPRGGDSTAGSGAAATDDGSGIDRSRVAEVVSLDQTLMAVAATAITRAPTRSAARAGRAV